MIFQSSSLEFHFPSKIDSSIFDVDRTVDMFKNFHSRTIIRFVLSIHRGGGHRFSMDIARGDIVQVSRPFFEDAHSNFLHLPPPPFKMEEVRCLEESRSVFSHWNWIWTRGKRFGSGNSRANVLAQESSGHERQKLRASFRRGRWPEKRNEETFFQG